jgi:hypothetical protein
MDNLHRYVLLIHVSRNKVIVVIWVNWLLVQDHVLKVTFLDITWDKHSVYTITIFLLGHFNIAE